MMLIDCPECGPRNEDEFHYGGQAHVAYPEDPAALSDADWAQYLFFRDNPKGAFAERWVHAAGCRRWFNAVRDTVTYEFLAVYRSGQPRPHLPGAARSSHGSTAPAGAAGTSSPTVTETPGTDAARGIAAVVPANALRAAVDLAAAAPQQGISS